MAFIYALFTALLLGPSGWAPGGAPVTDGSAPLLGAVALLAVVTVSTALACAVVRGLSALFLPDSGEARRGSMRRRSDAAPVPPQRDPDAAGKPRPRAPGAVPVAA
ncbi:DUF6412 domain-containing protein [Nocardiopsis sp. RSe5-2]|uniref:DUF6412 domain-containing protein n=1 Tax=Nocardiopsis endophytica TaxID=3018445 RepID=A0ABT4UAX7_9ACTN|nr:DUF6412 domain-containing protein [Nocardiopsis endophytica]MDA2814128.1 DUF6412 domain-containing protein [Nocardiopsis endophytica]